VTQVVELSDSIFIVDLYLVQHGLVVSRAYNHSNFNSLKVLVVVLVIAAVVVVVSVVAVLLLVVAVIVMIVTAVVNVMVVMVVAVVAAAAAVVAVIIVAADIYVEYLEIFTFPLGRLVYLLHIFTCFVTAFHIHPNLLT